MLRNSKVISYLRAKKFAVLLFLECVLVSNSLQEDESHVPGQELGTLLQVCLVPVFHRYTRFELVDLHCYGSTGAMGPGEGPTVGYSEGEY